MNQAWSPGTDVFLARGSSAQDVERSLPEQGERDDASRRDVGTGTGTGTGTGAAAHRRRPRVLRELPMPDTYRGVYCVRFNADGSLLASTYGSGAIQLRNPDTGELRATLRGPLEHAPPVMCARFHPILMDSFYAGGACGNVFQCSVKGSLRRFATEPKNEVNALDLNVAGDVIATGGKDATIRLYDPETAALTAELRWRLEAHVQEKMPNFHRMRIFAVRFHPQSRDVFLSAGWDDVVKVWDLRVPDGCVRAITGPHVCGDALDVMEMTVMTGSWSVSGSLQLWDLRSTQLLETVVPVNRPPALNGEFLYAAQFFSGDPYGDTIVCGGSGLPAVEIISVKQRKVLGSFRVLKAVQAVDSRGNKIAYGGMESVMRVGEFS